MVIIQPSGAYKEDSQHTFLESKILLHHKDISESWWNTNEDSEHKFMESHQQCSFTTDYEGISGRWWNTNEDKLKTFSSEQISDGRSYNCLNYTHSQ